MYVEQELAKKRGRKFDATDQIESDLKRAEDELYKIPEHLKVRECVLLYPPSQFFVYVALLCAWECIIGDIEPMNNWIISFQVKRRNSEESSTQWTTGIAEVQLPIE